MTDAELIELLRSKQICTGFKPDGHGDVDIVYGPDPVTTEAADRIKQLTAERDRLRNALTRLLEPYGDDPCYYDHHGYCQAHFIEADCCVAYARAALKGETP